MIIKTPFIFIPWDNPIYTESTYPIRNHCVAVPQEIGESVRDYIWEKSPRLIYNGKQVHVSCFLNFGPSSKSNVIHEYLKTSANTIKEKRASIDQQNWIFGPGPVLNRLKQFFQQKEVSVISSSIFLKPYVFILRVNHEKSDEDSGFQLMEVNENIPLFVAS